jgi:uncharacterized tellurite resistance protein B-like protein
VSVAAARAGSAPSSAPKDQETAKRHFQILAVVAFADRDLAPEEVALLDRIRDRLGLDAAEATRIVDAVKADRRAVEKLELSRPSSGGAELFEDMVKIVAADGVIHPAERKLLERACRALGVDEARLRSLLAYAVPDQPAAPAAEAKSWLPLVGVGLLVALILVLVYVFVLH